jgi:FAD/FMN-containing dehydrogenase
MTDIRIRTLNGGEAVVEREVVDALAAALRGEVLTPESPGYDAARAVWNGMIDRRPGLVVRAVGPADVVRTVQFAREQGLLLALRGGGHNIAGLGVCQGGLVLDLSRMRAVRVDPASRTARVEAGATLADLDHEAQLFGLATPVGINSTTGIAGLTLGGGFGWLSRKHGLTVDNLVSVDIVTAAGELLQASELEHEDLFWAIRGGGGNFGVVTSFEFRLHPVGPEVLAGLVVHPFADAPQVLREWRDLTRDAPDDLACWVVMRQAPPLPFLPPEWHGREVLVLAMFWAGEREAGEAALAPFRALGNPLADVVGPHSYAAWQQAFDPLLTPGARNYWKSHDFAELSDAALDALAGPIRALPDPGCEVFLGQLGGAVGRRPADATAYPHRDTRYIVNVHARWEDRNRDEACIAWARDAFRLAAPFASGGVYVNFLTGEEADRVAAAYGPNQDRLAELKRRYDPGNLFRFNQNIRPAVPA